MAELCTVLCLSFDHRADTQALDRFKNSICHAPFVEWAMETCGSFDMILQIKSVSLADHAQEMERIRPQLADYVARIETSFEIKRIEANAEAGKFMWLPCDGGHRRVEIGMIDKVIAQGDYMHLFIQGWNCLIHSTIRALGDELDARFIQLHRSSIVRIDFIDRLEHNERRWIAHLHDGSQQAIAKSHAAAVRALISNGSSGEAHKLANSVTGIGATPP